MNKTENQETAWQDARDSFIAQWGSIGSAWGINRTMAQIHALLIVASHPLTTDNIMAELKISRGNAHSNLRELISWGLVKSVIRKGERKEYFVAEKEVWKMFCTIARERKRREIDPALEALTHCYEKTKKLKGHEARDFNQQIKSLKNFLELAGNTMEKITALEHNQWLALALKMLKIKNHETHYS
ncbi:MAG: transcriptional regulator [Verrucomicrobiia bacterium]